MAAYGLKDRILEIEAGLSEIDREKDSAVYEHLMTKLYSLLISNDGIRYFQAIYNKKEAKNSQVAKEPEDYLSELWMEARLSYDPQLGHLLHFISSRMEGRIIDDKRKGGGLTGIPRDPQKRSEVSISSIDQPVQGEEGTIRGASCIDLTDYGYRKEGELSEDMIMDAQLHELASQILHFSERHSGKKIGKRKKLYYGLFYSTDIINFLKRTGNTDAFQHERDTLEAMHFGYTNFCTAKAEQYSFPGELSMKAIRKKGLALNADVLPADKITDTNKTNALDVPLQNEVVRGYMEREEHYSVSSANISQQVKEYRIEMYYGLRDKELSYAEIVYPDC